jgi:hypothetical protein
MPRLRTTHAKPVVAPPPRPSFPGCWCSPGCFGLPGLLILQMQVGLGAERPPRHQHPGLLGDDRIRMDDPQIHSCDSGRVQVMLLDGDGRGGRQPQPPPSASRVTARTCSAGYGSGRASRTHSAACDRQSHPLALDREGAVVAADRDQGALAPREAGPLVLAAAFGGLEPGVAVALEHRPCPYHRQLPERSGAGELAAARLVAGDRLLALLVALPVGCPAATPTRRRPTATARSSGWSAGGCGAGGCGRCGAPGGERGQAWRTDVRLMGPVRQG